MSTEQKEAKNKIDALLNEAYTKVSEAEMIADEAGVTFNFEVSYGMGGTYYPAGYKDEDDDDDEDGYSWLDDYGIDPEQGGWVSSSQTC